MRIGICFRMQKNSKNTIVMKHIICVTESLAGGGAEHQMAILANLLYDKGYQVSMVTFANAKDHYPINEGINRVCLGIGKGHIGQTIDIIKYFLTVKADCVISYRQCSNARVSIPLLFRPRLKLISGERNTTYGAPDKFEKLLINYKLYKRSNFIVPNSHTQARYIESKRSGWKDKIMPIINYTDLNQFKVSYIPDDMGCIRIGIFARFSEQKNPIGFCKMLNKLKHTTKQKFMVEWYGTQTDKAGQPAPEYLKVKHVIEESGISDVIQLKPAVPNPAELMDKFHVLCLPSFYEGFSNSVAESICSGKPVLCSDVSDNSVMVHNGENGFLFDPTDEESMVSAFQSLFALNRDGLVEMGRRSRVIAEQLFDKDKFINSYISLIESNR